MRIEDLIESYRQKALAPRGPRQCRGCGCEILPAKGRGRPRLTCVTCDLIQAAAALTWLDPRVCQCCGIDFRPERNAAKFCSNHCRYRAYNAGRRSRASKID